MIVARVDVGPRKRHVVEVSLDLDEAQQPDDRRQLDRERDGMDFAVVLAYNLDLALEQERQRLLPVDNLQRLVRRVQEKRLFHSLSDCARPLTLCQDNDTVNDSKNWELGPLYSRRRRADMCRER